MNTLTSAADTVTVWPVFTIDFNQCTADVVWTIVRDWEILTWDLQPGTRVIVQEFQNGPDAPALRFFATVTAIRRSGSRSPSSWLMEARLDEHSEWV